MGKVGLVPMMPKAAKAMPIEAINTAPALATL
jgi:hypothetical protein